MKIKLYIQESINELVNKVTWPTWSKLQDSAIVVMIASVIIALVIFLMDYVFGINPNSFWHGVLGYIYELFY